MKAGLIMDVDAARDLRLLPISDETFAFLKEQGTGFPADCDLRRSCQGIEEPVVTSCFGTHVIAG